MKFFAVAAAVFFVLLLSVPLWKRFVYRFKWGIVAANAYQDLLRRTGLVRGQIGNPYTEARDESEIPDALNGINHTFEKYMRFVPGTVDRLEAARVLEIGPGNNVGIALRFVAEGAAQVVAIDKFVPFQDTPFHQRLYLALRDQLSPEARRRLDEAIQLEGTPRLNASRLCHLSGKSIEEVQDLFTPHSFDLIVSNAVIEEIYEADAAFRAMDRLLRPGGRMIHVIDLGDYGMFSKHGFHPLEFLTVPDAIYRYLTESVGQPNRRLVDYYRATMTVLGYSSTIHVTSIVGGCERAQTSSGTERGLTDPDAAVTRLDTIRPRLIERYRTLEDGDLLVAGIFLEARKPLSELRGIVQARNDPASALAARITEAPGWQPHRQNPS